jgi:hypothetical protein
MQSMPNVFINKNQKVIEIKVLLIGLRQFNNCDAYNTSKGERLEDNVLLC